jgi:azurin
LANTDNTEQDFDIWFRKNGVDLPNSNTQFTIAKDHAGTSGKGVAALNLVESFAVSDNFELIYAVSNTAVTMAGLAAQTSPYVRPATPSVILTVVPVGA